MSIAFFGLAALYDTESVFVLSGCNVVILQVRFCHVNYEASQV